MKVKGQGRVAITFLSVSKFIVAHIHSKLQSISDQQLDRSTIVARSYFLPRSFFIQ